MSDTDFYNRNLYRNYPLVEGPPFVVPESTPGIPDFDREALVDFGIVFLEGSGFDTEDPDHKVYPLSAQSAFIRLQINATGAAVDLEIIEVTAPAVKYEVNPFTVVVGGTTYAYGFMVIGDPAQLPGAVTPITPAANVAFIERRCVQVQKGHYVNKISIANQRRVTALERCLRGSSSSGPGGGDAYPYAPGGQNFVGDVRFREGYNADIVVLPTINAIRFSARRAAGAGEACKEVPRTHEELARQEKGLTLDESTLCHEVISSINGVQPDISGGFTIRGGRGVEVTNPAPHTIRIAGRDSLEAC